MVVMWVVVAGRRACSRRERERGQMAESRRRRCFVCRPGFFILTISP